MSDEIVLIDENLAENDVKVHLCYVVLNNFDNTITGYDYQDSVIIPETKRIIEQYTIENIKEDSIIAAYRKFYWTHLHIDPTKIRPSGEALVRRILQGKKLPKISYFVDAYNWGSCSSLIPIGSYDLDKFISPITIRYAREGESYAAIGGKKRVMKGNEILTVGESNAILSQFPYRDADETKITNTTQKIIILSMGVEDVPKKAVRKGITLTLKFLQDGIQEEPRFKKNEIKYLSNF